MVLCKKAICGANLSLTHTKNFDDALVQLDLISYSGESTGLVFADDVDITRDPTEVIALEYAKKYGADAVYFRRFDDGRPPIPQIYIYDNTDKNLDAEEIGELHRKLWNSGRVPLFFIFSKTDVRIFNCFRQPNFDKDNQKFTSYPLETIKLAAEIEEQLELEKIKAFSAKQFDNGSFWQTSDYKDEFKLSDSAYEKLLTGLKQVRREIIKRDILPEKITQKLLVMSILVKYLEEREDNEGNRVFPKHFFKEFAKEAENFVDILKTKGAPLKLFDYLSKHFNGEIFRWDNVREREYLLKADLGLFADFLEGKIEGQQYVLWRLYSFNDLPIELISNIYEEFLESKEGVVYTPPYLVNFLIDECMPLKSPREDFKVLDPACGSGVFLVAAYRRIIYWWRFQNNWEIPDLTTLKKLLSENIYGVDIHDEAVRLTIFSLSLALCDELSPKVIWEELKFDNLIEKNLFDKDFFELVYNKSLKQEFDLVIGNPPFIPKLTIFAKKIEAEKQGERVKLPDNHIALLFLEQSITLCKDNALLCLILPSGALLYNNNSDRFRKYFLEKFNVPQILDFTSLSGVLFGSANFATIALFVRKDEPNNKSLLHITVRRTKPTREKIYFELDHYDFHKIPYSEALNSRVIWKSNLLGGGRLRHLIIRLSNIRKLGKYLENKKKNNGWVIGEGFQIGNKKEIVLLKQYLARKESLSETEIKNLKNLEKKYKKAEYLTQEKTLPAEAFTEQGISESKIFLLKEEYFYRNKREIKKIFKGPHLLIKKKIGKHSILIALRNDHLTFTHSIIGIYAPDDQHNELKKIEETIKNNKIYLFYIAGFSGSYMINRATAILKKDIDNLPYPEDEKEFDLSEIEKILVNDVLDYILEFHRKGENSNIVKNVKQEQLRQFGEVYCKTLNSVYDNFMPHDPIETESFICFPFYYQKKPEFKIPNLSLSEEDLNKLAIKKTGKNLRITRILRIYEDNIIYLIKPKQLRYWLKSIAIRDADETFADLVAQGY